MPVSRAVAAKWLQERDSDRRVIARELLVVQGWINLNVSAGGTADHRRQQSHD